MFLSYLVSTLLYIGVVIGVGWPAAARLKLEPGEKLTAAVALSLLGVFLAAWTIYLAGWPRWTLWAVPVAALAGAAVARRDLRATLLHPEARQLAWLQALVGAWCVGWLATVGSYSGGGWAADWFEHWQRTQFFLERWPLDQLLLGVYPLPARPPLANVVTGALLYPVTVDFAHYQLISTLLGVIAFLPAALLVRRFGGGPAATGLFAVLLMVNPMFVQNATFAWTKLPAAFFVLTGLHFVLRAMDAQAPRAALPLGAACLASGILAHYSAGPYTVMLALLWLFHHAQRPAAERAWFQPIASGVLGGAILATWFAWSFSAYGTAASVAATSSVKGAASGFGEQAVRVALNFRDTIVPHFLRPLDTSLIAQRSPSGALRDFFFQCYQVNLPFAFGSAAWLVLLREVLRLGRGASRGTTWFWSTFTLGVLVLGVATHGSRDHWGLAHICLQALVILGLALVAARWHGLTPVWRRVLIAAAAFDFVFGIAWHFAVQNFAFERWAGGDAFPRWPATHTESAVMNLAAKFEHKLTFFGDAAPFPIGVTVPLLFAVLVAALGTIRRCRTSPDLAPACRARDLALDTPAPRS